MDLIAALQQVPARKAEMTKARSFFVAVSWIMLATPMGIKIAIADQRVRACEKNTRSMPNIPPAPAIQR